MPEWLMLLLFPVGGLVLSILFSFLLNYLQAPKDMKKEHTEAMKKFEDQLIQQFDSVIKWVESPEGKEWQKEQERKRRQRSTRKAP